MSHRLLSRRPTAAALALLTCAAASGCSDDPACVYPAAPPGAASVEYACAGAGEGDGSEADPYGSLSEAVDEASPGAVILIAAGTYAENVVVEKSLSLVASSNPDSAAAAAAELEAPDPYAIRVAGPHVVTV